MTSTTHWSEWATDDPELALRFIGNAPAALIELLRTQVFDFTLERRKLAACGSGCYIPCSTSMRHAENIHLGVRVIVGPHTRLWASENAHRYW